MQQGSKKKVLIISYLFPPIGGGGVQRALKMAKYLRDYGWEPHVLTVTEDVYFASKDFSLLDELPEGIYIHRAQQWDPLGKMQPVPSTKPAGTSTKQAAVVSGNQNQRNKNEVTQTTSWKRRIINTIKPILKGIKNRVLIPDDQILWYKHAVEVGTSVVKEHNIQAIFSTSGPNTNHLVALSIKNQTSIPWIADFRDPWTDNMHRSGIWWREKLESILERKVVKNADCIMTVTESFLRGFEKKYRTLIQSGAVVHNGYDISDYKQLPSDHLSSSEVTNPKNSVKDYPTKEIDRVESKKEKMKLAYTGIFYNKRNPRLLLRTLQELIHKGDIDANHIELHFAGIFDYPGQSANWDAVVSAGLQNQVVLHGQLPHKKALSLLANSDLLLLIADTDENAGAYIPGKLFEYIAIGKPIFALSHQGESADIISSLGNGVVINPTDLAAMKLSLVQMYQHWLKTGQALTMPTDIFNRTKKYQRHEQARMLAEKLDILVEK
ncbi:hypothetical protein BHU72_05105 [Desulfuribacillus stibiiarsenatis]|uniref:Glycosyltransferase subfamily 4-like N-terminal domain-containing protein n=1 Tax=Desulfuribacillus stibiiarsenatis TaxID=1390249 RepID=A0A1E5L5S5_9FIRM|nr:glycosyltransferase [Desulfuribacillus stibiiarsenatis]OEH85466.1 hypothetical protein BHU72_05105 [Desulfuribacillus stibiiarsenatis]